jgi:formylglycine-generating enzyme required for sulfatase activity
LLEDVILVPGAPGLDRGLRPGQVKVNPKDGQRYVWIPSGLFTMGCSAGDNDCAADEKPAHEVTIGKGFWMGQTPVTMEAWRRYRAETERTALLAADSDGRKLNEAGDDNLPAVFVTWQVAREFCRWTGNRLPTEAEWEYAARAGNAGARYGNLEAIAWYADNSGRQRIVSTDTTDSADYAKRLFENGNGPHAVGEKQPNTWNLYDMLGNVWQWTADVYDANQYARGESRDPLGPPGGKYRVLRGGSWYSLPVNARASNRGRVEPDYGDDRIGFRCVAE